MGSVEGRVAIQYVLIPSLQPRLMMFAFQRYVDEKDSQYEPT